MNMRRKILILTLAASLTLSACGDKKENIVSDEKINSYEHIFSNVPGENINIVPEYDEDGYMITNDLVYVSKDNANLLKTADSEGEKADNLQYGTELVRTSLSENGYSKISLDDKVFFISNSDITTLKIDKDKDFKYSVSALNIVETTRQFYTYDDMCEDIMLIRQQYPEAVKVYAIGLSWDNRTVYDIVLGNPDAGKKIIITGGMSGCEYMSSLVLAKYIEYYARYAAEGLYKGYSYKDLLNNCCIHIIPMVNPDGIAISQFYLDAVKTKTYYDNISQWFERDQSNGGTSLSIENYLMFYDGNVRGCDINMNFPYKWEETGGNSYPGSKNYKGDSARSENETLALIKLIDKINPDLVINMKTSGSSFNYYFGQNEALLKKCNDYANQLGSVSSHIVDNFKFLKDGYGSFEGYVNNVKNIPCLRMNIGNGNAPLSLNEYNSIWNSTREMLAEAMIMLINN